MDDNARLAIEEKLVKAGFSKNESKVFLSLLELGRGTVAVITRKAGLNRTTGYDILDNLVSKGLVSVSGKEPKQEYVAESPDNILIFLEKELQSAQEKLEGMKQILPEIKSIHNVSGRPKVRFYEGAEGIKQVYEDALTSHEEIRMYVSADDMLAGLPEYFSSYQKRQSGKNISLRAIVPATPNVKARVDKDHDDKHKNILVSAEKYYFTPEINIYDDKVMIASVRERLGIIIESAEIADVMKKIFELAWTGAQKEAVEQKDESVIT